MFIILSEIQNHFVQNLSRRAIKPKLAFAGKNNNQIKPETDAVTKHSGFVPVRCFIAHQSKTIWARLYVLYFRKVFQSVARLYISAKCCQTLCSFTSKDQDSGPDHKRSGKSLFYSEKYSSRKFGKVLQQTSQKYSGKSGSQKQNHFFPTRATGVKLVQPKLWRHIKVMIIKT